MNRPRTTGKHLPPRMVERRRLRKSGTVWIGYYYYAGKDASGKKVEVPLGTDLDEAKRRWAELEGKQAEPHLRGLDAAFKKYRKDIIPKKAAKTQTLNLAELETLEAYFRGADFKNVKTKHLAAYRDGRKTKKRMRADGTVRDPGGKPAPVAANRELALFSDVWNMAREWGYTDLPNPARGMKRNKETPRDFYAADEIWNAVRDEGVDELQIAMDLAYLTGQRPSDMLKFGPRDVINDELLVSQGKTGAKRRIMLTDRETGARTRLGQLIDTLLARKIVATRFVVNEAHKPIRIGALRDRFNAARTAASMKARQAGDADLADQIERFQFRDARAKAASEIEDIREAQELLAHTSEQITRTVYTRVGKQVKPTR